MNQWKETPHAAFQPAKEVRPTARIRAREIAFIGLMGAVSAVLMLLRFPLPFLPPFLSFDLAGVMEIIGGFMFGPVAAFFIIVVKILLQLVMQGSLSFGTGEVQGLILSCTYVMPALLIYHFRKSKTSAAAGMAVSTVLVSVVAVFTNLYLIIPFYARLFGMTMDDIVAMCSAVNPAVKNAAGMVIMGIVPFNLIKYGATSVVTFFVYKRLSGIIRGVIHS